MHLTALVDAPDHVCCRYRVAAFQPALAGAGHALHIQSIPRSWWGRVTALRRVSGPVLLQRRRLPGPELWLLRRRSEVLFFDFDDAVWLRDSYAAGGLPSGRRLRRFAATVRAADIVIAGNPFLAEQAERHSATQVVVIPTCVNPDHYPLAAHTDPGGCLAWIGSASTLRGLEQFAPTLEEIGRHVPGASLRLICDRGLSLNTLPVELCRWSEQIEAAALAAADIGVAWMPDDDWSRGKCGLKVLQYMAAGLPVIANPVGVHCEMVRHGETGFLATTPEDWVSAARTLAADPDLRRRLGAAGRRLVERRYSVAAGAQQWVELLNRVGRVAAA